MIKNFSLLVFLVYFVFSPFFVKADTLWQANGSNIYNVGTGKVGVGINSPTYQLHLKTPTANYGLVHTDGIVDLGTFVWNTGALSGGWFGTKSNHNLYFFTNNSNPRVTLDVGGKMGIGTTTPYYPLDVFGSIGIGNTGNGYIFSNRNREIIAGMDPTGFYFAGGAGSENTLPINIGDNNSLIKFSAGNQQRMTILGSSGNVGIGTTNPTQKLSIGGGGILMDNNQSIKFKDSSGNERNIINVSSANNVTLGAPPTGDIYVGSSPAFVVKSNGNVGIGTATPVSKLNISSGASRGLVIDSNMTTGQPEFVSVVASDGATQSLKYTETAPSSSIPQDVFQWRAGGSARKTIFSYYDVYPTLTIDTASASNGIGIGTTTPTAKLSLSGWTSDKANWPLVLISTSTPSATSTAFIVDSKGKVGIGTGSPKAELDVKGSIYLSGNIVSDGDICIGKCQ